MDAVQIGIIGLIGWVALAAGVMIYKNWKK
jgi:hypothetical protein